MAGGRFLRSQPTQPPAGSVVPPQSAIELAVDLVAVLDGLIAYRGRLGALEFDLMVGAKPFQHGIETLTRPWKQVTKLVDGGPIATLSDASIGRLKLLALGLRI